MRVGTSLHQQHRGFRPDLEQGRFGSYHQGGTMEHVLLLLLFLAFQT